MSVELLAPVGSYESFIGAINEGADAIYLGGEKFSARANCEKFSDEEFQYMIDYAHEYEVKVYVAFNTLIKQEELKEAFEYGLKLYNMGVDALIVQDPGLIYMFTKFKELEVHASTQLSIHNLFGAKYFKDNGITRIVVARELSIEDIRTISEEVETEGFIHGAICVSYSGQCTMSGLISDRSGNRGRCAQPCRMEYSLIDDNSKFHKTGFLMSTKDLMTINILPKLLKETKIKSLKIEGRMKRGEYVVNTVRSYKEVIREIEKNKEVTDLYIKKKEDDLLKVFNREGFTNGYMLGYEGEKFLSVNNPKNQGTYLGEMLNDGYIILKNDVSLGDGISSLYDGCILTKILYNNEKVSVGKSGMKVKLFPTRFSKGDKIFKTNDQKFERELRESFKKEYVNKNYVNANFVFEVNKPMTLELKYKGYRVKVFGGVVDEAINTPLDRDRIITQLKKGSIGSFSIGEVSLNYQEGYINISKINELRRESLTKLRDKVVNSYHNNFEFSFDENFLADKKDIQNDDESYIIYVSTQEQFNVVYENGYRNIIISPFIYRRKLDFESILSKGDLNLYVKFPTIIKDSEMEKIFRVFEKFKYSIKGILTSNAGILRHFRGSDYEIIGDVKLNVFNEVSTRFYKEIDIFTISVELSRKEIFDLSTISDKKLCMFVYGKTDIMVSEYCPIGTFVGKRSLNNKCSRPCTRDNFYLKDRVNNKLLLTTEINCKIHTYKEKPIDLISEINEIKNKNINVFKLDFIDESCEDVQKILNNLFEKRSAKNAFSGNYYKPVE